MTEDYENISIDGRNFGISPELANVLKECCSDKITFVSDNIEEEK